MGITREAQRRLRARSTPQRRTCQRQAPHSEPRKASSGQSRGAAVQKASGTQHVWRPVLSSLFVAPRGTCGYTLVPLGLARARALAPGGVPRSRLVRTLVRSGLSASCSWSHAARRRSTVIRKRGNGRSVCGPELPPTPERRPPSSSGVDSIVACRVCRHTVTESSTSFSWAPC